MTSTTMGAPLVLTNVHELREQLASATYADRSHYVMLHNAVSTAEERNLISAAIDSVLGLCGVDKGCLGAFSGEYVLFSIRMYHDGWELRYEHFGNAAYAIWFRKVSGGTVFSPIFARRYKNREDESND